MRGELVDMAHHIENTLLLEGHDIVIHLIHSVHLALHNNGPNCLHIDELNLCTATIQKLQTSGLQLEEETT